jgi:hypothetical protein
MTDYTEEELEDDINHDWWTVVGFWHESWERWAGHYDCITAQMAEDLAQMEAKEQGGTLAVVAVFEGKLMPADKYATWIDPEARSERQMMDKLRSLGYIR